MIEKRIKIPIYNVQLCIYYDNHEELKKLNDSFGYNEFLECFHGRTFWHDSTNRFRMLIRNDVKVTAGVIAHECKHMVNFIFISRGIELDLNNDEPECYLLEWLINKIHSIIKI